MKCWIFVLAVVMLPHAAGATLRRIVLSGAIVAQDPVGQVRQDFVIGDTVNTEIIYDTSASKTVNSSSQAVFFSALESISTLVNGQNFRFDREALGSVFISNDSPLGFDVLQTGNAAPITGPSVNGSGVVGLNIVLSDSSQTVFGSTDLPTSIQSNAFDDARQLIVLDNTASYTAAFNSVSLVAVPEPATTTPLIGSGILLAVRRKRRKLQSQSGPKAMS